MLSLILPNPSTCIEYPNHDQILKLLIFMSSSKLLGLLTSHCQDEAKHKTFYNRIKILTNRNYILNIIVISAISINESHLSQASWQI